MNDLSRDSCKTTPYFIKNQHGISSKIFRPVFLLTFHKMWFFSIIPLSRSDYLILQLKYYSPPENFIQISEGILWYVRYQKRKIMILLFGIGYLKKH